MYSIISRNEYITHGRKIYFMCKCTKQEVMKLVNEIENFKNLYMIIPA